MHPKVFITKKKKKPTLKKHLAYNHRKYRKATQDTRVGGQSTAAERARTGGSFRRVHLSLALKVTQSDPKCGSPWQSRGRGKGRAGRKLERERSQRRQSRSRVLAARSSQSCEKP